MFGLYTVDVKLTYDKKPVARLCKKYFLFKKSAETFAEEIDGVGAGVMLDYKGSIGTFGGINNDK